MKSIREYLHLIGKHVMVFCTDGVSLSGVWYDRIRAEDNEPYGESILLELEPEGLMEIYVDEIERIEEIKG